MELAILLFSLFNDITSPFIMNYYVGRQMITSRELKTTYQYCITSVCFDKMMSFRSKFDRINAARLTSDCHFHKNFECNSLAIVFIAAESEHFIGLESHG